MRLIQGTTLLLTASLSHSFSLFISTCAHFVWHINLFTLFIALLLFFLLNTHKTVKITIASTVLNMKLSQSPYFYCHKCLHFFRYKRDALIFICILWLTFNEKLMILFVVIAAVVVFFVSNKRVQTKTDQN